MSWGASCQKNKKKTFKKCSSETTKKCLNVGESEFLSVIKTISDDRIIVETSNVNDLYTGNFPRLLPFLTSVAREHIYTLLLYEMDHVKLILTDGFLVDEKLFPEVSKKSANLGDLVYCGYYENFTMAKSNTSYDKLFAFVPFV